MATIFLEGFDHYGPTGIASPATTTLLPQEWNGSSNIGSIVTGLSSTGYAYRTANLGGSVYLIKTLPASYSRLIGGVRFSSDFSSGVACLVSLLDNGSAQVSTEILTSTGQIRIHNAAHNGTVLATSTAIVSANSTHYLEWDITFGASANYTLWLDGTQIITGTGNTKSTANSSANQIQIGYYGVFGGFGQSAVIFDDIYLFDTSGSVNNSVVNTSPRIETQFPNSDSQTQWTNAGNVVLPVGIVETSPSTIVGNTNAPGAGQLVLVKVTPAVSCTLQSVTILPSATSASAKFKAVLYSNSAGAPNTLTSGSTTEITGTTANTALALAFNTPQSLTGGTSYWIGYITDTSVALAQYDNTTNLGQKKANTYASGAPAGPLSGMTTAQPTWMIWGLATGATTNWQTVATNPAAGSSFSADTATITSTTVGNEDLYSFPALTTTPAVVHAMSVKANAKISGTGTRTIDLRCKSSTTDSAGTQSNLTVSSSYLWYSSYFDRDPNGTIAWTKTSVDAAAAGPKVNS